MNTLQNVRGGAEVFGRRKIRLYSRNAFDVSVLLLF
jgi:hypothetical protein